MNNSFSISISFFMSLNRKIERVAHINRTCMPEKLVDKKCIATVSYELSWGFLRQCTEVRML